MADNKHITDNLIEMYGRNDWAMNINFKIFLRKSGIIALDRNVRILDCGCAMGHLMLMLRRFGFKQVKGLDASLEMAEAAKKNTGMEVIHSDILDADKHFEENSFDVVIISDLVHHLDNTKDWDRMFLIAAKILSKKGCLVIREPAETLILKMLYSMSRHKIFYFGFLKARLQSFLEEDSLLRHFFAHWKRNYKEILTKRGFAVISDTYWLVHQIICCRKGI
ncbi:MAG: class I SAM-dependent methyltransferase [Candidatus Omnitrophica bacterium]|nr:class I SAM-dependent methyltransferase [Candidatus Omnitrophota bacterium]